MRPRPARRGAFTLVEALVAAALFALALSVLWQVFGSARRQGRAVERGAALMQSAALLREVLAWDLLRSLPPAVLAGEPEPRGVDMGGVTLPYYAGYEGDSAVARRYRALRYSWDEDRRELRRGDRVLLGAGLADVRFRWSETAPTALEVRLVAVASAGEKAPEFVVRLPAPGGTDGARHWRSARHHRGAWPAGTPEPTDADEEARP